MKSAYQWGLDHRSCQKALEQRKALGPQKTQSDWWLACDRGDWLIWQLQRLDDDELQKVMPNLLRAINVIADRAVKNHALKCGVLEVEQWAEKWLTGEDRSVARAATAARAAKTARSARASTWTAEAAAARSAWASTWTAEAAERAAARTVVSTVEAATAAAGASWAAERKRQADDIRAEIPEWIWS